MAQRFALHWTRLRRVVLSPLRFNNTGRALRCPTWSLRLRLRVLARFAGCWLAAGWVVMAHQGRSVCSALWWASYPAPCGCFLVAGLWVNPDLGLVPLHGRWPLWPWSRGAGRGAGWSSGGSLPGACVRSPARGAVGEVEGGGGAVLLGGCDGVFALLDEGGEAGPGGGAEAGVLVLGQRAPFVGDLVVRRLGLRPMVCSTCSISSSP